MTWMDNPGLENTIVTISGGKTIVEGTEVSGTVRWGDRFLSSAGWIHRDVTGKPTFAFTPMSKVRFPGADYSVLMAGAPWSLVVRAYT